jgi:hypothetical protein
MDLISKETSRVIARQVLTFKKNSPHIFFGLGIAGFVGTTVLASRATLKLDKVLDEFTEDLENVKGPEQDNKDVAYVYGKGTVKLVKLYAPSALLGTASVLSLTGSHVILTRRNSALAGTLAIVTQAFDEYRERVKKELGEEKERDIRYQLDELEIRHEDGTKEVVKLGDATGLSMYARFFDEFSPNWQRDWEYNRLYVQCQQNYANQRLETYGHVFLNDVYDWLGIERTRAGAIVGWLYNGEGDGYIDFGIFDVQNRDFVNGPNPSILLDFNVDGVIYDKI